MHELSHTPQLTPGTRVQPRTELVSRDTRSLLCSLGRAAELGVTRTAGGSSGFQLGRNN